MKKLVLLFDELFVISAKRFEAIHKGLCWDFVDMLRRVEVLADELVELRNGENILCYYCREVVDKLCNLVLLFYLQRDK